MKKFLLIFSMIFVHLLAISQTFDDVTTASGIQVLPGMGDLALWIDYNNDGWLDFFGGTENETFLYKNNGDGTFTNVSASLGLTGLMPRTAAVGDFDNDGYDDLLICSFHISVPVTIYRNKNGEGFEEAYSTNNSAHRAIWIDYNTDGLLDFIVSGESGNSYLYLNQGNNNFVNASEQISFTNGTSSVPAAGDFNNDGLPDIYFASANTTKTNRLFMNVAGQSIKDATYTAGVSDFRRSVSVAWGDMDNDGFLEIYYGNISSNRNVLLHNKGNCKFEDVTLAAGVQDAGDARTCTWQDINNDGWCDLFTTNHVNPNKLYINNADGTFTNIANSVNISGPQDGFGVSWGDYDKDGDLDVLIAGHSYGMVLMNNNMNTEFSFLNIKLVGVYDNRSAIGARVTLYCDGQMQIREVNGGRGATGQDALELHFGLGEATKVDSVHIKWPSGALQKVFNINANQFITIEQEGNIPPTRFRLHYPLPDSVYTAPEVEFAWQKSTDPDSPDLPLYLLHIFTSQNDTIIGPLADTIHSVQMANWMSSDTCYWHVQASDGIDITQSWDQFQLQYESGTYISQQVVYQMNGFSVKHYYYAKENSKLHIQLESDNEKSIIGEIIDLNGKVLNQFQITIPKGISQHNISIPNSRNICLIRLQSGIQQLSFKLTSQ
mgnify:CR=1 FL=1